MLLVAMLAAWKLMVCVAKPTEWFWGRHAKIVVRHVLLGPIPTSTASPLADRSQQVRATASGVAVWCPAALHTGPETRPARAQVMLRCHAVLSCGTPSRRWPATTRPPGHPLGGLTSRQSAARGRPSLQPYSPWEGQSEGACTKTVAIAGGCAYADDDGEEEEEEDEEWRINFGITVH